MASVISASLKATVRTHHIFVLANYKTEISRMELALVLNSKHKLAFALLHTYETGLKSSRLQLLVLKRSSADLLCGDQ